MSRISCLYRINHNDETFVASMCNYADASSCAFALSRMFPTETITITSMTTDDYISGSHEWKLDRTIRNAQIIPN